MSHPPHEPHPLVLEGAGSCSEVRVVCKDADNREIGQLNAVFGTDNWFELPEGTRIITVIPIVDMDL